MTMQRRGFLRGMAGILAAGAAPAIIHDAMKIVVPRRSIVVTSLDTWDFVSGPGIGNQLYDPAELQRLLLEKIRNMAYQMYKQSNFVAAAESVNSLVIQDPTMVRYLERT
ncbi:hypothetical protein D3C71_76940 [compost metagenome]